MYFQQKIMCFALWARVDTKLLNLSHHVLSMDGWPGDATFFLLGQPLKIIRMYSAKKGPAPWNLFLTPAPRPFQVTFLVGEAEHMWFVDFFKIKCMFSKKTVFEAVLWIKSMGQTSNFPWLKSLKRKTLTRGSSLGISARHTRRLS